MGIVPSKDLKSMQGTIRYRMIASGEQKISIRAIASTGRIGYAYQRPDQRWDLVVRNYDVNPSAEYADFPWDDTSDYGYSTQACNVCSALGRFSELEYHVPAIGDGTGRLTCQDNSQVWAFRGSRPMIERAAGTLFGGRAMKRTPCRDFTAASNCGRDCQTPAINHVKH